MKIFSAIALCSFLLMSCANKNVSSENQAKETMTGAYTESRSISKDELTLFNDTYKGNMSLTPVSVSTQVVAGTNYAYICKDKNGKLYKVTIYQKLPCYGGEAQVTSVEKMNERE